MNRFLFIILPVFVVSFVLLSCSEENISPENAKISQLEENSFICSNSENIVEIHFTTNAKWSATTNAEWCELSPTFGNSGNQVLVVKVYENSTNSDRNAIVTIECGFDKQSVTIQQKQNNFIELSSSVCNIEGSGGFINLSVTSNMTYTYNISDDWVSMTINDEDKGTGGKKTYTIKVDENKTTNKRTATIVFLGENISKKLIINQEIKKYPKNYDFECEGLFYKILSIENLTATVVGGEGIYSGDINIPDRVTYNGKTLVVTSIDDGAFYRSNIGNVTLGRNIEYIGRAAFYGSLIEKISIPASVKTLYERSFDECIKLSEVIIEDGTSTLYFYCSSNNVPEYFVNCPIRKLYIGRTIDHWPWNPGFSDLSQCEDIKLGSCVTSIDSHLLSGATKITSLKIPSSVTFMGDGAFDKCISLKELIFEDGASTLVYTAGRGSVDTGGGTGGVVNYSMFCDSPIEYVYIGRNFQVSESYTSAGALLDYAPVKELEIGKGVEELVSLRYLRELEQVSIPFSISLINGFNGCGKLNKIYCEGTTPPKFKYSFNAFDSKVYIDCCLYVPASSIGSYKSADIWKNFFNICSL